MCPKLRTKFQLEILIINVISDIVYFREIILGSSRNVSETILRTTSHSKCLYYVIAIILSGPYQDSYSISQPPNLSRLKLTDAVLLEEQKVIQEQRVLLLRSRCRETQRGIQILDTRVMKHVVSDDNNRVAFCHSPSAGAGDWLNLLLDFSGRLSDTPVIDVINNSKKIDIVPFENQDFLRALGIRSFSDMPTGLALYRHQRYGKIMFVRNPFERIAAVFKYLHTKSDSSASRQSFDDFVLNLTMGFHGAEYPSQIIPFSMECQPCTVAYDFVGKIETLESDLPYLLHRFFRRNWTFPITIHHVPLLHNRTVAQYFKSVPEEQIDKIRKMYQQDFRLFGYDTVILRAP